MTYWPISSPSAFAATKHTLPQHQQISHDGAEPISQEPHHGATADDSTRNSVADSEELKEEGDILKHGDHTVEEREAAERQPQQSQQSQLPEDDISGEIIAIRVTRSERMFATITRTTLTIWQTKVRLL